MLALTSGLEHQPDNPQDPDDPIVVCTDSMVSPATLRAGPTAQTSPLGVDMWRALSRLSQDHRPIHVQWVSAPCGMVGSERADTTAKRPQSDITVDTRTICHAVARTAREVTIKVPDADRGPPATPSDRIETVQSGGCPPAEGRALV